MFYKLGRAGGALERMGAIDFATTIAPGVRDVLLIGKVYEAVGRTTGNGRHQGPKAWDAVVLDAPPTGRITRFLNVNVQVADLAKVGPIHSPGRLDHPDAARPADRGARRDPARGDAGAGDRRRDRRAVGCRLRPRRRRRQPGARAAASTRRCSRPRPPSRSGWRARVRDDLAAVGVRAAAKTVSGLLGEAHDHAERVELERSLTDEVASQGLPTLTPARARAGHRGRRHRGARRRAARPGGALMAARSGSTARSSRAAPAARTAPDDIGIDALLADPATGIIVCCGSGGVGKTTTAAALGLRAAEAGRRGRRAHHRPGAPAGPVARAHRARQHPAAGGRRRRRRPAARCTR